jgi:hypothetical protein
VWVCKREVIEREEVAVWWLGGDRNILGERDFGRESLWEEVGLECR